LPAQFATDRATGPGDEDPLATIDGPISLQPLIDVDRIPSEQILDLDRPGRC
jgi:hypothetical protein